MLLTFQCVWPLCMGHSLWLNLYSLSIYFMFSIPRISVKWSMVFFTFQYFEMEFNCSSRGCRSEGAAKKICTVRPKQNGIVRELRMKHLCAILSLNIINISLERVCVCVECEYLCVHVEFDLNEKRTPHFITYIFNLLSHPYRYLEWHGMVKNVCYLFATWTLYTGKIKWKFFKEKEQVSEWERKKN